MKSNKTQIFYDALGSEYSGLIFKHLENKGVFIAYGRHSNNRINDIDPMEFVFKSKIMEGFWLTKWVD